MAEHPLTEEEDLVFPTSVRYAQTLDVGRLGFTCNIIFNNIRMVCQMGLPQGLSHRCTAHSSVSCGLNA